jgi:hypothetical protein
MFFRVAQRHKGTVVILGLTWALRALRSTAKRREAKAPGEMFAAQEILLIR